MRPPNPSALAFEAGSNSLPPLDVPEHAGRLVVVAPHPDDETLGAGGLAYDLNARGWEVEVVIVTDGSASHPDVPSLAEIRSKESQGACEALGLPHPPIALSFRDGHVSATDPALIAALRDVLAGADVVVTPRPDDGHNDHEATARAVEAAVGTTASWWLTKRQLRPKIWRYAVWGWDRLSSESLALNQGCAFHLSLRAQTAKAQAMASYPSQTTDQFGQVILPPRVLDRFRASHEVFWC